jgi:hypothetical protein
VASLLIEILFEGQLQRAKDGDVEWLEEMGGMGGQKDDIHVI